MDTKFILLVVAMLAYGAEAVTIDEIPKCVEEFWEAFKGYDMPESVDTYSQAVHTYLDEVEEEEEVDKVKKALTKEDCQAHLKAVEERTAKVPCHKEFFASDLSEEYEESLYENAIVTDIILGAQLCEGFLSNHESPLKE